jgi:hypothetical protein
MAYKKMTVTQFTNNTCNRSVQSMLGDQKAHAESSSCLVLFCCRRRGGQSTPMSPDHHGTIPHHTSHTSANPSKRHHTNRKIRQKGRKSTYYQRASSSRTDRSDPDPHNVPRIRLVLPPAHVRQGLAKLVRNLSSTHYSSILTITVS